MLRRSLALFCSSRTVGVVLALVLAAAPLGAQTWIRTYGSVFGERPLAIAATTDGGCVVVATETSRVTLGTVFRLDAAGNVLWQRVITDPLIEVRDAAVDAADHVVIVGAWHPEPGLPGNWDTVPWIARLDGATGAILWEKTTLARQTPFSPDSSYFTAVACGAQGGYLAVGIERVAEGVLACKVDAAGTVEWQMDFAWYSLAWEAIDVAATPDGGFVMVCSKPNLWIIKIDALGGFAWAQAKGPFVSGTPLGARGSWVDATPSGDIVVHSHFHDASPNAKDLWVMRFDRDGEFLWERMFDWGDDEPAGLAATANEGCVLAAKAVVDGVTQPWLIGLDEHGNIAWQRSYAEPEPGWPRGIASSSNGELVVAASSRTHGASVPLAPELRVLRLDSEGSVGVPCLYGADAAGSGQPHESPGQPVAGFFAVGGPYGSTELPTQVPTVGRTPFLTAQCASNAAPWQNLGSGLAGTAGVAHLAGVGTLQPNGYFSLILTQARPSSPTAVVVGAALANAPLFGGTLVPALGVALPTVTAATGRLQIESAWPPGLAPGFELYAQVLTIDPVAPWGMAFSNAVKATSP